MKAKILSLSALVIFALALCLSVTTTTPASPKAPAPAPAAVPAPAAQPAAAPAVPEPHPEIREALASLRRAKEHLEHAAHDFGGHRVEAIAATDNAIRQLELCLKFDKD